jgi:Flp pilus assembly protein TadB
MPVWIIILFIGLFALVLLAVGLGLKVVENQRRRQVAGMIQTVSGESAPEGPSLILRPVETDTFADAFNALPFASRWDRLLKQAGLTWTGPQLLLSMAGGGIAGLLIGIKVHVLVDLIPSMIGFACLFGSLPYLLVARKRAKRMKEFETQFPDALDFLARSMRAGHAFSVSLEMLADEMSEPLSVEFRQVFNEQNLGSSIDAALSNLQLRVPSLDVGFFVSAVMLQKQTGGNLAEILTKLAFIIRERFRLKLKVRSASAHGRLTGTILTFMPMVLMLILSAIAPEYLPAMVNDPLGRYLVSGAMVGQLLGYLCIRKIINIKV